MKLYEKIQWKKLKSLDHRKKVVTLLCASLLLVTGVILRVTANSQNEKINDKDFTFGVLALNTDRTVYNPGDSVMFYMASLDSNGDTLCKSNLQLEIYAPKQRTPLLITSNANQIVTTPTCGENNVTNEPDYIARYVAEVKGEYKIKLTNLDTHKKVVSKFVVQSKEPDFQISRYSATRINPFKSDRYPMVITVTANKDFKGILKEEIPLDFEVMWQGAAKTSKNKYMQTLTWEVALKAEESKEFSYEYKAPLVSPDFIRLGNARISSTQGFDVFKETAQWQIASDFSCQSNTASGNWSASGSWTNCNSTTPQAADTVTILNGHTITLDASPSIAAIDIQNGGTLSADANSRTLTLTDAASYVMFTKGATGTFNPNNSTVVMAAPTAGTLTSGAITFNNLTISPTILANRIQSFGSGAITINGNFTINPTAATALSLTVNMGADITLASTGTTTITRTTSATAILDVRPASTNYNLSTGYLNIATGGTLDCTSASSTITLKGTSGTLFTRAGTFTVGTSEVIVTSASGTPVLLSAATTFHKLTINSTATVINAGFLITINNVSGAALTITAGVLNDSGLGITGPGTGNGTLTIGASGTLCLGGSTTAATTATCDSSAVSTTTRAMPSFQIYSFNATSTVIYLSNANTTISATPAYGNLRLMPLQTTTARTYTLGGAMTINGDFDIFPSNGATQRRLTVNAGGNITMAATSTLKVRANAGTTPVSTFSTTATGYSVTVGKIDIASTGTLTANSSSIQLTGTSGTLFTRAGTFTQGTSTVSVNSSSGSPTLNSGTVTFYGLDLYGNYTSILLGAAVTISSAGYLRIQNGILEDNGNQITCTATCTGNFLMSAAATIKLGNASTATTFPANFTNITLDAGSTVTYQGNAAQTISRTPTYANLRLEPVLSADRTYTFAAGTATVNGDMYINPSGTANRLTVNMGGNLTIASTKTLYIQSTGGSATSTLSTVANTNALSSGFINIASSGTLTAITTSSISLTGITGTLFTNDGTFTQATSTVNVTSASGTPSLIGGSSTTSFHILTINAAATVINAGGSFTINNAAGAQLNITTGVFNTESRTITGPGSGNGTFTIGATGTFCVGGTTSATTATCDSGVTQTSAVAVPTFQTYTLNAASNFIYLTDAAQTIAAITYGNLSFKPKLTSGRAYTFAGAATVNGNFDSNPTAGSSLALTINLGGTTTVAATGTTTLTGTTSGSTTLDTVSGSDYAFSTGLLNIATAGTLLANNSNITLTGTSGTLFTRTGTFTAGGSTVIYNGDGTPTSLTSGTFTFNNLSLSPTISSAGRAYTFGAGDLTINGNFTIQPTGSQLLTVNMAGNITVASTGTTSITRSSTATSSLVTGASNPSLSSGIVSIATGGTLDGSGSTSTITLTANGASFVATGTFTPGSTTVAYIPTSTSGVTVGNATYHNVTFNKASNTFSLTTGGITTDSGGNLTITAGVLDAVSGSNYPITIGGNWINSVGSGGFLAQNGAVIFDQSTTASITGTTIFYDFTSITAGKTIQFEAGTTFTIGGLFTIAGSSSGPSYVTLTSSTGSTSWTIKHLGTESITYANVSWGACDGSSTNIAIDDATSLNGGNNGACWVFPAPPTYPTPHTSLPIHRLKWLFDEGQSGSVGDNSEKKNTGTIANATWQIASANQDDNKRSTFLRFDGTGDYVSRATDVDFDFDSNSFTITGWFRHPVTTSGTQTLFSRTTAVNGVGYKIYMDSTGHICFGIDAVAGSFPNDEACTAKTYLDSTWHHFAGIKTDTTSISIYVDGYLGATTTGITSGSLSGTANLYVGTDVDGSTNGWNGDIDNIVIYPDILTEAQVKSDMLDPSSVLFGANASDPLTNGLVGWWKLDETSGNATDSSGNSSTLTDASSTTYTIAKFSRGADLESSSTDYLYVADNAALSITGDLTLAAWINPETITAGTYNIIAKWDGTSEAYRLTQEGDEIRFELESAGNYVQTTNANLATATWYHVSGVYNAAKATANIYINGELAATTSTGTIPNSITDDTSRLQLGAEDSSTSATNYYDGIIDDARIYNKTLTPREVTMLYNYAPGPIAWWKLDDNKDTTPNDSSGNGNDCTMNSMPTQPWIAGKYGSALKFDGTNDETDCGSPTILDDIAPMSLSVWINPSTPPSGWGQILSKSTNDTPTDGWLLQLDSSNVLSLTISFDNNGTNVSRASNASVVTNGTWAHIEATWDGTVNSTGIRLYVNGQEVIYNGGNTATGVKTTDAAVNFTIGNENSLANDYAGLIDDVKVYNYVRTPSQVLQDMAGGRPNGSTGGNAQTAYWKLDEQAGQTINNTSPANTFTTTLGTTAGTESTDPNWYQENNCIIGGCLNFDGTDDVLTITNSAPIDFDIGLHSGFTMSAWIYPDTAGEGSGGRVFYKGATTWLRVDTLASGKLDIEASLDLVTTDATVNVATIINQSAWNHVAMSYTDDAEDEITIWVNGKAVGTSTNGVGSLETDGDDLLIGGDTSNNFDGRIDDIKIYHNELNSTEMEIEARGNVTASLGGALGTHNQEGFAGNTPVAEWNFDESTGTSVKDSSGNGNTGTLYGSGTIWTDGKIGKGVKFNGTNNYMQAIPTATISSNFTVATWIKPTSNSGNITIFSTRYPDTYGTDIQLTATGLHGDIGNGTNNFCTTAADATVSIPLNQWTHIAYVITTGGWTIYVNGQYVNSGAYSCTPYLADATNHYYNIGTYDAASYWFPGSIDKTVVYDYARSAGQIAYDYNRGAPLAWYKMDECSGATVYNATLNSNGTQYTGIDGTISLGSSGSQTTGIGMGTCTTSAQTPRYNGRTGKYTSSLNFDGTDDYVSMGDNLDIGTASWTVSTWVKTTDTDAHLISKGAVGTYSYDLLLVSADSTLRFTTYQANGATHCLASASAYAGINDGNWHHVAGAWTPGSSCKLYVDGKLKSSSTSLSGTFHSNSSAAFMLGYRADNDRPLNGQLDDVRIYNYALSNQQMQTVFNENSAIRFGQ